ncbi:hypothetical protein PABG_06933 [Paracoccidioides brasiliensis Pb03]|nr:hypothetical protein PABG_06933 [Paracoccidioides brasiliensis Pb03]
MDQPNHFGNDMYRDGSGFRGFGSDSGSGFGDAINPLSNGTGHGREDGNGGLEGNRLVHVLLLKFNLQNRFSVIITASFSVAASMLVILSIMYESWKSSREVYRPKMRRRFEMFHHILPAHSFPLILSFASICQSLVLLGVQSTALKDVFAKGCSASSQITWTVVWVIGYVVLVFTSETVIRIVRPSRFAAKGRWNSRICWVLVAVMLLLTWIPSSANTKKRERCLATLLQLTAHWSDIGLGLTISLIVCYIVNGTTLSIRLWRTAQLDAHDRIAASSIVYYLAGTTIVFTLVLPFWVQDTFWRIANNSSTLMGSVALNSFGIVYAFIYLLLRANGGNMMIGPGTKAWMKHSLKRVDSTELALEAQITTPIVTEDPKRPYFEKEVYFPPDNDRLEETGPMKPQPTLNQVPAPRHRARHSRKPSNYSLFPARDSSRQTRRFILNFNTSREDILAPPRPSYARHRRFSSDISAATVQIGLRLSNIAMPGPMQHQNSSTMTLPFSLVQDVPPVHSSPNNGSTPTASRFQGLWSDPKPFGELSAGPPIDGDDSMSRVSPKRQNTPSPEFIGQNPRQRSPPTKRRIDPPCINKNLPPTPSSATSADTTFSSQSFLLADPAFASPPPLQPLWSPPDPLSILPNKTFREPDHWI